MDEAIREFDVLVYCKSYERTCYESFGQRVFYMPLGYCDEMHRPLPAGPKWNCTGGFLGGWEPRRELFLHAIADARIDLKIWGGYWEFLKDGRWTLRRSWILKQLAGGESFSIHSDPKLTPALQGGEVYGDEYAQALSGAKINIGFLRKVCPDQHTTRTFEIPACGSMLLADRTDEHREFFAEGKEADYFSSIEEFVEKVKYYSNNPEAREAVAQAGRVRCIDGRYAYIHRLQTVLSQINCRA
jgi:spore maturation protein CgeB